ncbi:LysR family transcriptional regulator [Runella sp.]|uniref:winged helix-turn-helix domain-containing protein n=1 Tax=Runella sp. TaxID=1960881 RepID=UPI00286D872B|nr:LysR family transcriptional regulator [Runella sp.]
MKQILKDSHFRVSGSLWIEGEEKRFLGPGRVELLERINDTGSINQAAKQMGMSYKKAWEMVNSLNSQVNTTLVMTQTGGEKGGGAIITEEAKQLIMYYHLLRKRFETFLETESRQLGE